MIPAFDADRNLPPGVHVAKWDIFVNRYAYTPHRKRLIDGLAAAIAVLRTAGCSRVYVDGSFVAAKPVLPMTTMLPGTMIKNERQYRVTKAQAEKFAHALRELASRPSSDPLMTEIETNALESQLAELRRYLQEYDELRAGERTVIVVDSLDELPRALVQARIAAGLSQRDLAERLGLKEQQIQRYEATDYESASLTRLGAVARALGLQVRGELFLPVKRDRAPR